MSKPTKKQWAAEVRNLNADRPRAAEAGEFYIPDGQAPLFPEDPPAAEQVEQEKPAGRAREPYCPLFDGRKPLQREFIF